VWSYPIQAHPKLFAWRDSRVILGSCTGLDHEGPFVHHGLLVVTRLDSWILLRLYHISFNLYIYDHDNKCAAEYAETFTEREKKKTRRGKENASRIIAYIISHETIDCCVRFYEIKYFKNCKWVSLFLLLGRETIGPQQWMLRFHHVTSSISIWSID
jgi:hypothetical protein